MNTFSNLFLNLIRFLKEGFCNKECEEVKGQAEVKLLYHINFETKVSKWNFYIVFYKTSMQYLNGISRNFLSLKASFGKHFLDVFIFLKK